MDEKELGDRLSNIKQTEFELPEHRRQLRRALLKFAQARTAPAGKAERTGMFPRRLVWQPIVAGVLIIAIVASLALALPSLTGNDKPVSAAEIALANPEVQAALGGLTPGQMNVADNINTAGYSRVVIMGPWDKVVIAYVDVLNNRLVGVLEANIIAQDAGDATDQRALEIVNSDPHMQPHLQALLSQGMQLYFMRFTVVYPDTIDDPQGITGLPVLLFLKDEEWAKYYFLVDLNTGAVSSFGSSDIEPLPNGAHFEISFMEGTGYFQPNFDDIHAIFVQIHDLSN